MYANLLIGGDIHQGDLIAVADGNDFTVGIYFGRGRGGTVQYYSHRAVIGCRQGWEDSQKNPNWSLYGKPWNVSRIYKNIVNTPRTTRIMKLNKDNITNQHMIEDLQKAKEILSEFNIPVNF